MAADSYENESIAGESAAQSTDDSAARGQKWKSIRDELSELWKPLLSDSRKLRTERFKETDEIHNTIVGKLPATVAALMGQHGLGDTSYIPVPKLSSFMTALLPSILGRNPRHKMSPLDDDAFHRGFALCSTTGLDRWAKDGKILLENQLTGWQGLVRGLGAWELGKDSARRRPFCTHINVRNILIDPQGTQTPGSERFRGREMTIPLETARRQFRDAMLESNTSAIEKDRKNGQGTQSTGFSYAPWGDLDLADAEYSTGCKGKQFSVMVVYERAGSPSEFETRLSDSKRWSLDPLENDGLSGLDRILFFDAVTMRLLDVRQWKLDLNHGEFPITLLRPTLDPDEVWPSAPLGLYKKLQDSLTLSLSLTSDRALAEGADVHMVDETAFQNPEELDAALTGKRDRAVLRLQPQKDARAAWQRIEKGKLSPAMLEWYQMCDGILNDTSNYNQLYSGTNSSSATEAELNEQRKEAGLVGYASTIALCLNENAQKMQQIAMSRMTGDEMKLWVKSKVGKKTEKGYEFWPEDWTVADITMVDVGIEPGSTDAGADMTKARDIQESSSKLAEVVGVLTNAGFVMDPEYVAELTLGPLTEWCRLVGLDYMVSLLEKAKNHIKPAPPPPPPPPVQNISMAPAQMPMGPDMMAAQPPALAGAAMGAPAQGALPPEVQALIDTMAAAGIPAEVVMAQLNQMANAPGAPAG